jgi:hypothetical protein
VIQNEFVALLKSCKEKYFANVFFRCIYHFNYYVMERKKHLNCLLIFVFFC